MRGNTTRGKDMTTVMSHQGFGALLIYRPSAGIQIEIPNKCLRKDGKVKKGIGAKLSELTIENLMLLNKKHGVCVHRVNHAIAR